VITLDNGANTTGAIFRGDGMGSKLNCFWVQVTGQPNDSACHYFERQMVSGSNVFRLHLQEGKILPEGAVIYYDGKSAVGWQCDQNNNLWASDKTFYHTYGTTCATLDAPVLNDMDANYVLDFTSVTGANYYTVSFYSGHDCVYSGRLEADGSTTFRPFFTDTYEIVVQAWTNSGLYSNESNKLMMELTGDPQYLPASEVCELPFKTGSTSAFSIVAETDNKGVITLTTVAIDGGAEASTKWRGDGLPNNGLKFNGQPASQYFTRKKTSDNKSIILTPIQSAKPELGRLLTFNEYGENENAAWYTSQNNNAYANSVHFTYRYGTVCPKLATPVITAINDSVPQFEAIEGADEYVAQVYLGGQLKYKQYIHLGDRLHFVPDATATYQVTLVAYGEGVKHSDTSSPFDWVLQKKEIEVGPSEYCNKKSGTTTDPFVISFETLVNGDVEITISGDAQTAFRGNGLGSDLSAFKVGALGANEYFEPQFAGAGSLTYTLHIKDPNYVPAKGEKVVFSGTVEYVTANNSNAYGTYTYTYTYGSVCDHLETPVITSLQADGTWTLDHEIEGAEAYRVTVYRDGFLMQNSEMQYGEKLTFSPWHDFIYLVSVQALTSKQVMNSNISNPYEWRVKASGEELPISSVCNKQVASDGCGSIYLTGETLASGQVVFKIHNTQENIIFRSKGLDKLLFVNDNASSYFDVVIPEEDSTQMVLTPKKTASGMIYTGDPIISQGNLEWISDCNNNGYTKVLFTYLYGTDCTPRLTRLSVPSITEITPLGDITFAGVDNAQSYLMRILDEDDGLITETLVASGERIDRYMVVLPDFNYYVMLQAWPETGSETYRESLWSDPPYLWNPSALPTGMQNAQCAMHNAQCMRDGKYIINGQFVIICNGIRYNAQGCRL